MSFANKDNVDIERVTNERESMIPNTSVSSDIFSSPEEVPDENAILSRLLSTDNNSQQDLLPVPAFTALLILLGNLYVTVYGIYVGLNGFPDDNSPLPRIF